MKQDINDTNDNTENINNDDDISSVLELIESYRHNESLLPPSRGQYPQLPSPPMGPLPQLPEDFIRSTEKKSVRIFEETIEEKTEDQLAISYIYSNNSLYSTEDQNESSIPSIPSIPNLLNDKVVLDYFRVKGYTIRDVIGTGTFSNVYKISKGSELYALKVSPHKNQAFEEYEYMKNLNHKNIVKTYDIFVIKDISYMIMELHGQDLYEYMDSKRPNKRIQDQIIYQLCDVVGYCHSKGIYHRDIKPENILIKEQDGQVDIKLMDFGLATKSKKSNEFIGSYKYLSPEGFKLKYGVLSEFDSEKNDIWSIGIVIVNLMSNKHPWKSAHLNDKLYCKYLSRDDFFSVNFGVSSRTNNLLYAIFSKEKERCSIKFIQQELTQITEYDIEDEKKRNDSGYKSSKSNSKSSNSNEKWYKNVIKIFS